MMSENKEKLKQHQYADSGKFSARIYLHQAFRTNPYPWPCWVFDQFSRPGPAKVLELGGGNGLLWMANARRIPDNWDITVSDISEGMLADARSNLAELSGRLHFQAADAERIPYSDGEFDIVIANHMLYHVDNRRQALSEIKRVLKPDGVFYASTIGSLNMLEMKQLVVQFDPQTKYDRVLGGIESRFSLENGRAQLLQVFGEVETALYEDALKVTDSDAIVRYVLSLNGIEADRMVLDPGRAEAFKEFLDRSMEQSGGAIHISKASGIFICKP